jgi:hypothetical protein
MQIFIQYIRKIINKAQKEKRSGKVNRLRYDRRKNVILNKTIQTFINVISTNNGFITGTELSTMIHKYFKVKISERTIQDCRHRQLGMVEINILLKKEIRNFDVVCF